MRKKWTKAELGYVKRWYRRRPTAAIAEHLGVTAEKVRATANRIGIGEEKPGIGKRAESRICRYHALGWSDSEIAAKVGCCREYVGELRRKLGLPSNAYNEHYRARVAAKTREQCRKAGVRNLAALRVQRHAEMAKAAGWPGDLRLRHVQILDLLYDHGAKTRREIAEATGMPWKGSRQSLTSNDPEGSYLAHLMVRGFVMCLPRKVRQGGQGKNVSLYMIPPYVRRDEKKRKESQCQERMAPGRRSRRSKTRPASRTNSAE
jgi:hypothetical protein